MCVILLTFLGLKIFSRPEIINQTFPRWLACSQSVCMCVWVCLYMCLYVCMCVQLLDCVWLFVTPWIAACQASLSFTIYQSLLRFMSTESMMPSNRFILHRCLLHLPSIFPSIGVFFNELTLPIRWPKNSMNILGWFPLGLIGLISFRIDWFDLFAVQGTLKSLLQHHSLKASILQYSAFYKGLPW